MVEFYIETVRPHDLHLVIVMYKKMPKIYTLFFRDHSY